MHVHLYDNDTAIVTHYDGADDHHVLPWNYPDDPPEKTEPVDENPKTFDPIKPF